MRPLLTAGALFYICLAALLYTGAWVAAAGLLRVGRRYISPPGARHVLTAALFAPPLLAAVPLLAAITLSHSYGSTLLGHHSEACLQLFAPFLQAANLAGGKGSAGEILGLVISGLAWLLPGAGFFFAARLLAATVRLERDLHLLLQKPGDRLQGSLDRMQGRLPGLPPQCFYECPIPRQYSSVLGLFRPHCILSQELIASCGEEEMDAVVAHEAYHLQSGDCYIAGLAAALERLFFYLPPVQILARWWREETELSCDDAAVFVTKQPLAMAAAILRASGMTSMSSSLPASETAPVCSRILPDPVRLGFINQKVCSPARRVERLLAQAEGESFLTPPSCRSYVALGWIVTLALGYVAASNLLSASTACSVHCGLEAAARFLP